MGIPRKMIPIVLKQTTPTELTPARLREQLHNIGLTCEHTDEQRLKRYIDDVRKEIPKGRTETFAIFKPQESRPTLSAWFDTSLDDWELSSLGNWEPDGPGMGYGPDLHYLIFKQHFDWLRDNRPSFPSAEEANAYKKRYDSVDAIKEAFKELATTASAALVKGLNKDSIESIFSNAIAPLNDKNARDYDKKNSRVVFLVENYDPASREAEGIGALAVEWHLMIKDYKEKKKLSHDTELKIEARSILYGDLAAMKADLLAAKAHFKGRAFAGRGAALMGIPAKDTAIEIYEKRPPANETTFLKSLPLDSDSEKARVMVMFTPDLQNIGSINNSGSKATATYAKSVTTGFTFSSTQQFSIKSEFEAGIVLAKGSLEIGFTLSFTEQSSKSTTETINFSVPPGEIAFTYQGDVRCQILEYDPVMDTYQYKASSRFLSPVIASTKEPIIPGTQARIRAMKSG